MNLFPSYFVTIVEMSAAHSRALNTPGIRILRLCMMQYDQEHLRTCPRTHGLVIDRVNLSSCLLSAPTSDSVRVCVT